MRYLYYTYKILYGLQGSFIILWTRNPRARPRTVYGFRLYGLDTVTKVMIMFSVSPQHEGL